MREYHKIETVFLRDVETKKLREWLEEAWDIIRQILGIIGVLIGFFVAVVVFTSLAMLANELIGWMFGLV